MFYRQHNCRWRRKREERECRIVDHKTHFCCMCMHVLSFYCKIECTAQFLFFTDLQGMSSWPLEKEWWPWVMVLLGHLIGQDKSNISDFRKSRNWCLDTNGRRLTTIPGIPQRGLEVGNGLVGSISAASESKCCWRVVLFRVGLLQKRIYSHDHLKEKEAQAQGGGWGNDIQASVVQHIQRLW